MPRADGRDRLGVARTESLRTISRTPFIERPLIALVAAFAVAYSLYGLFRHWRFDSSAYDLGIFDQVLWHLSRFEAPSSTIRGYSNMLGDHFSPILALLAPLYWMAPAPEAIIVAQAILLAISIVPVWRYARRRLPRGAAYALSAAYGLFWGMQRTAAFDFHELAFAPLLVALAIVAIDEERWILFWTSALTLVLVKEDLIPLIGGFGLLLLWRHQIRRGVTAIAVSILSFALVVGVLIPSMSDVGRFGYTSAYAPVIDTPWRIPIVLFTPAVKLRTTLLFFAPFLFLPLASPLVILVPPLAVERFLSTTPNHWGTVFHYWAPVAPILAMGAADGLARLGAFVGRRVSERRATHVVCGCAIGCVVLSAILPGHQPLLRVFTPTHYRARDAATVGGLVIEMIPRDAIVVAQGAIVPHLSHRDRLFVLDAHAPESEYVVATDRLDPWPLDSIDELRRLILERRQRGYVPVFERDGWILLRRAPPG